MARGRRPYYNNDTELTKAIRADLINAMNDLDGDIYKELQKSFKKVDVPIREGGIATAWDRQVTPATKEITFEMKYNPRKLQIVESYDPFYFRHASPVGSEYKHFAELIEKGYGGSLPCFGGDNNPTREPRPYWKTFTNTMNKKLHGSLFLKCCKKAGIGGIERG